LDIRLNFDEWRQGTDTSINGNSDQAQKDSAENEAYAIRKLIGQKT
jgi:hypothetical protein